jgi:Holliday junction resolvase RusA-like endonuclease
MYPIPELGQYIGGLMEKRVKSYKVDICPVAWARPGGKQQRYDAQKDEKMLFGLHVNKEHKAEEIFDGPLGIDIAFVFKYPSAKSRGELHWYTHVPDIDNLEKFLFDTLKDCGVVKDDKLFVKVSKEKIYGNVAHVEFTIREL